MIFLETTIVIVLVVQVIGLPIQGQIFLGMIIIPFMTVIPIKHIITLVEQIFLEIMFVINQR